MENYDNMIAGISTSREGRGNDSRYLKTGKLVFASRIFRRVRKIKKKKSRGISTYIEILFVNGSIQDFEWKGGRQRRSPKI